LYANSVGSPVVKGEPLFTVYSPELLTAQQEFLETLRYATNPQSRSRVAAAHRRLRLWDVTESQIAQLKASGQAQDYIPMMANHSGIVIAKEIHAGSAFHKGERLMRTADISRLWVEAQVYDYELPLIQPGMKAIIASPNIQNNEYVGTVDYIYPFMQGDTHTARVRIILDNADGLFLPDMYVQVRLRAKLGKRLVVPESAVLYSGTNRIVFLALGDGRFAPRKIKTGQRNRQWIEVLDGLLENDTVVTSGNFLISAESKLKAGLDQW
jgi:Cu(I)/Ag(I) efflux system membrane fusion protein